MPMPNSSRKMTMDPANLKKWLFVVAIIYLLFPRDLIPDYMGGGFGLIDDVALMGLLAYYFRNYVRQYTAAQAGDQRGDAKHRQQQNGREGQQQREGAERSSSGSGSDPYSILGVSRGASQEEIRVAYHARMQEYHPDKVAHLGDDLQELALRKSQEIQQAYQRLRR
jgi:uncharacterized membrane protein YkvA (DUF1232 family)